MTNHVVRVLFVDHHRVWPGTVVTVPNKGRAPVHVCLIRYSFFFVPNISNLVLLVEKTNLCRSGPVCVPATI